MEKGLFSLKQNSTIIFNEVLFAVFRLLFCRKFFFFFFQNIQILKNGGLIQIWGQCRFNMSKSQIINITSDYTGFIFSFENLREYITVEDTVFTNISSKESIFDCSSSNLILKNCSFQTIINFNIRVDSSNFLINQIFIKDVLCLIEQNGCIFSCSSNSYLEINDGKLSNISNSDMLGNIYLENSVANVTNLIWSDASAGKKTGACFYSENSEVLMLNSVFQSYYYNCLYIIATKIKLTNITFDNTELSDSRLFGTQIYGAVYVENCQNFSVINSLFKGNSNAKFGSGIMLINSNLDSFHNLFLISNCTFQSNKADDSGGAIYLFSVVGLINSSLFNFNEASYGGGIYYFTKGYF